MSKLLNQIFKTRVKFPASDKKVIITAENGKTIDLYYDQCRCDECFWTFVKYVIRDNMRSFLESGYDNTLENFKKHQSSKGNKDKLKGCFTDEVFKMIEKYGY